MNVFETLSLIQTQRQENNCFLGQAHDMGWGRLYGGHLLAQSCDAAWQTVSDNKLLHSLQGYFLRIGSVKFPITYKVRILREGFSISHRQVEAIQNGHLLFSLSASFAPINKGISHQQEACRAPAPETGLSELDMIHELIAEFPSLDKVPKTLSKRLKNEFAIDIRAIEPRNFLLPKKSPPQRKLWMRSCAQLDDSWKSHILLTLYGSDYPLLGTALQPHGLSTFSPGLRIASLDHNFWIHQPFRFDDWILFVMNSPISTQGRALVKGSMYNTNGDLVASCIQEGWMHYAQKSNPSK